MSVHALLARAAFRRSWGGLLAILVVLVVGLGAALTAIEAADRTVSAYPDYLERNDVADLVVNTVLANERTQEILESTPGVRRVVSDSLLTAAPAADPEGSSDFLQFRVSQDGRYTAQDRPVVDEGRMIRSGHEVFLSQAAAEELEAEVGEVVDVNFYGVNEENPLGAEPGPVVREVSLEVVGIGTFADSVRPDELFPRMYALVTPEAAGDADCLQLVPDPDDRRTIEELFLAAVRPDCAMTYRYYSLDVEGGRDAAAAVAGELSERFREENRNLPQALREANAGYFLIPTFTADDARSIRSSLAPVVAALRVFGVAAGLAVIGAVAVLVVRQHRRRADDLLVLRSLGLRTGGRIAGLVVAPAAAIVVGVGGATAFAWAASTIGPVASARRVDPHPGNGLGGWTVLAVAVAVVLALGVLVLAGWRAASRGADEVPRRARDRWPLGASLPALGLRAALRGRDAVSAVAGAGVAVAAVVTTLVFASAVGALVDEPGRYGWSVDFAFLGNYGYGPIDPEAIATDLDRADVEAWGTAAALGGDITVDGETVPALAGRGGFDEVAAGFPVLEGRSAAGAEEVALGATTARDLGLEVGDEIVLGSPFGEIPASVSGLVVMPEVGAFQSDRTSLDIGVLLPAATYEAVYAGAEEATGVPPAEL
ncbi:MAG TPA: ABC transporter permease, partial [Acidimicrobiales bacterium]|nr:ABC transporter permease [Acidimicrobiales bacterium]